jgi:hypothetical protein
MDGLKTCQAAVRRCVREEQEQRHLPQLATGAYRLDRRLIYLVGQVDVQDHDIRHAFGKL